MLKGNDGGVMPAMHSPTRVGGHTLLGIMGVPGSVKARTPETSDEQGLWRLSEVYKPPRFLGVVGAVSD